MARYIDADKLVNEMKRKFGDQFEAFCTGKKDEDDLMNDGFNIGYKAAIEEVVIACNKSPLEDVRPERYGKWIFRGTDTWECCLCGNSSGMSRYCPHCGAKMDRKEGETNERTDR